MSTPTGENPSGLQDLQDPESVARRARHVSDLDRLESMLVRREQVQQSRLVASVALVGPLGGGWHTGDLPDKDKLQDWNPLLP